MTGPLDRIATGKNLFKARLKGRVVGTGTRALQEPNSFHPTPVEAIQGLLQADGRRIKRAGKHGHPIMRGAIWENACGDGAMVREMRAAGHLTIATDLIDRGCPDSSLMDFLRVRYALAPAIITNPPFHLVNASQGRGRWFRHLMEMPGWDYAAMLLPIEWAAARRHGFAELYDANKPAWVYTLRWRLDFSGEGSPPGRHAWFVWDRTKRTKEPAYRLLDKPQPTKAKDLPMTRTQERPPHGRAAA